MALLNNPYPAIHALTWHRRDHYSFFLPKDWYQFCWIDGREGDIYGPDANDPSTVFAVSYRHMQVVVGYDDMDIVCQGFSESLDQLPACKVDAHSQQVTGKLVQLEAKYTFEECGAIRKCWQHVMYYETLQVAFTAQGATPERYAYWLPWFFEAMMTKRIHTCMPVMP